VISRTVTEIINIVVVVLNDKIGLHRTLNSILDQDIPNHCFRIIIVDGFSEDGSFELAKHMARHGDHVVRSEPRGIYDAMNVGLEKVFEYKEDEGVLFLNAGDFFFSPSSLSILLIGLALHSQVVGLSAFLDPVNRFESSVPEIDFSRSNSPVLMWIPHQAYCASIAIYKSVGTMNDEFRVAGDVDWFIRAFSKLGTPHHIPEIISIQIVGGTSRRYAYLGYQERCRIASRAKVQVDKYPVAILIRIYLSQKLGIRVPKILRRKNRGSTENSISIRRRYEEVSRITTNQEFPPVD